MPDGWVNSGLDNITQERAAAAVAVRQAQTPAAYAAYYADALSKVDALIQDGNLPPVGRPDPRDAMTELIPKVLKRSDPTGTTTESQIPVREQSARRGFVLGNEVGIAAGIGLLLLLLTGLAHPNFVSVRSLSGIAQAAAFFGIMSMGMVFLLAMREIDLSVGSMYGLTIVIAALMVQHGWNPWLAAAVGILSGAVLGAVNGIVASIFRVPVLIVTLGSLTAYSGIASALTNSQTISLDCGGSFFDKVGGTYFQVPFMVYAAVPCAIVLAVLFNRTRFGFAVRSIGSNPRAAELSGYRIARTRIAVTALSGALSGIAGMLTLAYFAAADPSQGQSYEIEVIAAAIIGGTSLLGGSGTVLGALLGALLISLIQAALIQFDVSANLGYIVTGVVIVAAVGLDSTIRRVRSARLERG